MNFYFLLGGLSGVIVITYLWCVFQIIRLQNDKQFKEKENLRLHQLISRLLEIPIKPKSIPGKLYKNGFMAGQFEGYEKGFIAGKEVGREYQILHPDEPIEQFVLDSNGKKVKIE